MDRSRLSGAALCWEEGAQSRNNARRWARAATVVMPKDVPEQIAGTRLSDATKRLFQRVLDSIAPDPWVLERFARNRPGFRGTAAASKRFEGAWKLWLPPEDGDYDYSIAHECGHRIVEVEQRTLRLHPTEPQEQYRQGLGLVLSLLEHVPAHQVIAAEGFNVARELLEKQERFCKEAYNALKEPQWKDAPHHGMAIGLADTGRQAGSLDHGKMAEAVAALQDTSPPTLRLGRTLFDIVTPERQFERDWRRMFDEISAALGMPPALAVYVYDADAFERRFGYY